MSTLARGHPRSKCFCFENGSCRITETQMPETLLPKISYYIDMGLKGRLVGKHVTYATQKHIGNNRASFDLLKTFYLYKRRHHMALS